MNDKSLTTKPLPTTDLTESDQALVQQFIADGLPGLASLDDVMIARVTNAYLEGKTYSYLAQTIRVPKALVLFLSDRFNWYTRRREYQDELALHIQNRIVESKIKSKDFLLQLTQFWEKKLGKNLGKYVETDDEKYADAVNLKEVDKYLKAVETLHKLNEEGKDRNGKTPAVGLNLGAHGVTVERKEDGSVEITPKERAHGDLLARYADFRRQADAEKSKKKSDIEEIVPETQLEPLGDKVDENN